jgi:hypothetical protein
VKDLPEPQADSPPIDDGLRELVDQELSRLPARYRTPMILCHLEGKGHKEAAAQLGWPVGTLSGRLSRDRSMLAKRLSRRGLVFSAGSLGALAPRHSASASVGETLLSSTIRAALTSAAGPPTGVVSAKVVRLARGVMKAMLLTNIRTGLLVAAAGAAIALAVVVHRTEASKPTQAAEAAAHAQETRPQKPRARAASSKELLEEIDWVLMKVDAEKRRVSALARWTWNTMGNDDFETSGIRTGLHLSLSELPVADDAEILLDRKPAKLINLTPGLQLVLRLSDDGTAITKLDARSDNCYFYLKSVDTNRNVISIGIGASGLLSKQTELPVAEDAKVLMVDKKHQATGGRFSDLKAGIRISFQLGADAEGRIVVRGIRAQE